MRTPCVTLLGVASCLDAKFAEEDANLAALLVTVDALVVTMDAILDIVHDNIGAPVGASITADIAVIATRATAIDLAHTE